MTQPRELIAKRIPECGWAVFDKHSGEKVLPAGEHAWFGRRAKALEVKAQLAAELAEQNSRGTEPERTYKRRVDVQLQLPVFCDRETARRIIFGTKIARSVLITETPEDVVYVTAKRIADEFDSYFRFGEWPVSSTEGPTK